MLEEQINGFIEYCRVSGFRDKSIVNIRPTTSVVISTSYKR